jgi:hyperosmotically inducible protein
MRAKVIGQLVGGVAALAVALHVGAQPASGVNLAPGVVSASNASNASNVRTAKAANRKLRRGVLRALAKTPGLDNERILVRVSGGTVTLSGSVPEADQIQKAGDTVQGVPGVSTVSNKITTRAY